MKENLVRIHCDGGSRGNPGPAAGAFVVYKNGKEIWREKKFLGVRTNNFAEYTALGMALSWVLKNSQAASDFRFYLDSELVVRQLTGVYKIKSQSLLPIVLRIKEMEKEIRTGGGKISYSHVLRSKNSVADELVNGVLDEAADSRH